MMTELEDLFRATLNDIALDSVLPRHVRVEGPVLCVDAERVDLDACDRIVIAALGKAAFSMTRSMVTLLGSRPVTGVAVGPVKADSPFEGIDYLCGRHPYPDQSSLRGANALLDAVRGLGERDLVIFLLSGGGSALAECPVDDSLSLADMTAVHRELVTCGAGIVDMNVVRKHLSGIKGGRLAAAAAPARQLTLFVSDVPVDTPEAVASGPTMPDASRFDECAAVIAKHDLAEVMPAPVQTMLRDGGFGETPKPGDAAFASSTWHCLLDNTAAVDAAAAHAKERGWIVDTGMSVDDWPVQDAVDSLLGHLDALASRHPQQEVCVITGGELSCPVTGDGRGGRNQAFVLEAARRIDGSDVTVLSGGTDGIDGNAPAAGAVADGQTLDRARDKGLDPDDHMLRSDSYAFFLALDNAIVTGPTGNNVRDLRILCTRKRDQGR